MTAPAPAAAPPRPRALAFEAIGTRWRIDADAPLDALDDEVAALVDRYDRDWSRFRADSLVARMAREGGAHRLPPEGPALLGLLRRLHDATDGAVTPLVGAAMEHHGYDADYTLRPRPGAAEVPAWD
ncbi:FAD:protein FMN transferase, partial [Patulibacter sp. S7RM1-6]